MSIQTSPHLLINNTNEVLKQVNYEEYSKKSLKDS